MKLGIKSQGHSLTLVKGHSDFQVKCLTFGLYTQVSNSGPHGPLVTKMMVIRGRASGWSSGQTGVNISFPKHTSATVRNILMALGRIIHRSVRSVACKNDNSSYLHFLIIFPDPYLYFISGPYLSYDLIYFNDTL